MYGTLTCMIAASACFDHASIVASADSFVGFGGFAEKPMRNVRVGQRADSLADLTGVFLHDVSVVRARTRGAIERLTVINLQGAKESSIFIAVA